MNYEIIFLIFLNACNLCISTTFEDALDLNKNISVEKEQENQKILNNLHEIYIDAIQNLENIYKFSSIHDYIFTKHDIFAKPIVLIVGPWSVGKSTMINYLLKQTKLPSDAEPQPLFTGAHPTTTEFTIVSHGKNSQVIPGDVLVSDKEKGWSMLSKFQSNFLEKLCLIEMPHRLLEKITLIDTPGIIENKKQGKRGYPFNEVIKYLISRASLVLILFDPTKLDVGSELERLFDTIKGSESKIRIVLNKADSLLQQDLLRVYGSLFWNLAPLLNVTEPPRIFITSFWEKPKNFWKDMFSIDEIELLKHITQAYNLNIQHKISLLRRHALAVKTHSLIIDTFIKCWSKHRGYFGMNDETLLYEIYNKPEKYAITEMLISSGFDRRNIPDLKPYKDFFSYFPINHFKSLDSLCGLISSCPMDKLNDAINDKFPRLIKQDRLFKDEL